jgi:ribonuclease HII
MLRLHQQFPHYGFDGHKGYPTRAHIEALKRHGASPVHRRSFAPVRAVLEQGRQPDVDGVARAASGSL